MRAPAACRVPLPAAAGNSHNLLVPFFRPDDGRMRRSP